MKRSLFFSSRLRATDKNKTLPMPGFILPLALVSTLAALSPVAHAQAPATSASPGAYEGRWRIVSGKRAPWHKGEPPFIQNIKLGVVLRAGMISGPSPFGCSKPRYTLLNMPPEGLFQGAFSSDRKAAATVQALGFAAGTIPTIRADCDNASFDFHATNPDTLKIAIDDAIYTLERRPELPLDDHDFMAPPEPSFSCARARTTAERVICTDEAAMLGDVRMSEQYKRLQGELSKAGFGILAANQRSFLQRLHSDCQVSKAMPKGAALQEAARCLADATLARARFFTDMGAIGTRNRLTTEPRFTLRVRALPQGGGDHVEYDATPFAVDGPAPARAAFNALVDATLRPGKPLHETAGARGIVERRYTSTLIVGDLLSLLVTQTFEGGTASAPMMRSVNWNDGASRPLALDDLFATGSDWKAPFRALAERLWADAGARSGFLGELDDIGRWSFEEDRVRIWSNFDRPGTIQSDCAYCGVELPASSLKPFLKADAPWKPQDRKNP